MDFWEKMDPFGDCSWQIILGHLPKKISYAGSPWGHPISWKSPMENDGGKLTLMQLWNRVEVSERDSFVETLMEILWQQLRNLSLIVIMQKWSRLLSLRCVLMLAAELSFTIVLMETDCLPLNQAWFCVQQKESHPILIVLLMIAKLLLGFWSVWFILCKV